MPPSRSRAHVRAHRGSSSEWKGDPCGTFRPAGRACSPPAASALALAARPTTSLAPPSHPHALAQSCCACSPALPPPTPPRRPACVPRHERRRPSSIWCGVAQRDRQGLRRPAALTIAPRDTSRCVGRRPTEDRLGPLEFIGLHQVVLLYTSAFFNKLCWRWISKTESKSTGDRGVSKEAADRVRNEHA